MKRHVVCRATSVKVQEAKLQSLSVRDQKSQLISQAKSLAEKIDKQTDVITEAELARRRYRDELAEVSLKMKKLLVEEVPQPQKAPAVGESIAQMDLLLQFAKTQAHTEDPTANAVLGPHAGRRGREWRCGHGRVAEGVWEARRLELRRPL